MLRNWQNTRGVSVKDPESFASDLQSTIVPRSSGGSSTPTFTRATTAYLTDLDGLMKQAISGEPRFQGSRRVANLVTVSEDLSGVSWTAGGSSTKTANTFTYKADNDYLGVAPTAGAMISGKKYIMRIKVRVISGTATNWRMSTDAGNNGSTFAPTATAAVYASTLTTSAPFTFLELTSASVHGGTDTVLGIDYIQIEEVTGQTITVVPSEYVSIGVLSAPYHGAGIDGVKYFNTQNGNSVVATVVTDADGAAISDALLFGYNSEGARTNLFIQSNDFTNVAWVKTTMTTAKTSTGPDGVANSATRLTASGAAATVLQVLVAAASDRTWSVWARRVTGTGTIKLFQGLTKTADLASQLNSTTYTQIQQDATVDITLLGAGIEIGTSTDAIDVWCGQFEAGPFASSPIPTTTVSVARNADVNQGVSAGNISSIETSLTMELTPTVSLVAATEYFHWASYVDASNYTALLSDGTNLIARKRIAGSNHDATIAWNRANGTTAKVGARFDTTNGVDVFLNGAQGTADTTTTASQIGAAFQVGADGNGANQDFCEHRFFKAYSTSLSASRLSALTT